MFVFLLVWISFIPVCTEINSLLLFVHSLGIYPYREQIIRTHRYFDQAMLDQAVLEVNQAFLKPA